jgi:hypothetical protein
MILHEDEGPLFCRRLVAQRHELTDARKLPLELRVEPMPHLLDRFPRWGGWDQYRRAASLRHRARICTGLTRRFPVEDLVGIAIVDLVAIGALAAVCFIAGLLASTGRGSRFSRVLERVVLCKCRVTRC